MKKRVLALIMTLVMLLGMTPAVQATGATEADVYLTVSLAGSFAQSKNSEQMVQMPVHVTDLDGDGALTLSDAFAAAHTDYHPDGAAAYTIAESGIMSRVWGVETTSIGYYMDNVMTGYANATPIVGGEYITIFTYANGWDDVYVYFDRNTAQAETGQAVALTLTAATYPDPEPMGDAAILVNGAATDYVTAADGTVTLYFPQPGTYLVSAASATETLVPTACKVTVTGEAEDTAAAVAGDKSALELPTSATADLTLPTRGASGKSFITWSSDNEAVISATGTVARGGTDTQVTLTATLTYGGSSDTKTFTVSVPALTDEELLDGAKAALEGAAPITPSQWNADFTGAGDTNLIAVAQSLVNAAVSGVTVGDTVVSEDEDSVAADGTITYKSRAATLNVTFTLTRSSAQPVEVTVEVTVPRRAQTRQSIMDEAAAGLEAAILDGNSALDNITSDLELTSLSSTLGYYVQVEWSVPDAGADYLTARGAVTRPAYGAGDASFTLTGTLSWYTFMEQYMPSGYVGPTPADQTVSYQLTIKAYTQAEYDTAVAEVDAALAAYDPAAIVYEDDRTAAELTAVNRNLMLYAPEGFTASGAAKWESSNAAAVESPAYSTGRAVVHRPAVGEPDATATLTLTLTRNGYSSSRTFEVTVPALTQEEVDAASAQVKQVADAIDFALIQKTNPSAAAVTATLDLWRSATLGEEGAISWSKYASPSTGYLISWTADPESVLGSYGAINRPDRDTAVTLTATVTSADRAYAAPATQTVTFTVTGKDKTPAELLMDGIAAGYTASSGEWVVLDMAAYEDYTQGLTYRTTAAAKQTYVDTVVNALRTGTPGDTDYAKAILVLQSIGVDPQRLYPVNSNTSFSAVAGLNAVTQSASAWNAPYTLAAYRQGDYNTQSQETALLARLLEAQEDNGSWNEFGTTDTTGNVLAALAFYMGDPQVDAAIDKAVTYLSGRQLTSGAFDEGESSWGVAANSNSTAMVILGLAAVGIDPDTDTRFIKDGNSALDGLLSFALADNSGFGRLNNSTGNAYATEQSFRALIAASQVAATGAAYNIYDFSANSLQPGRATSTGGAAIPVEPDTDETIQVYFTMKSDTDYWITRRAVQVKEGSTVYHAFVAACTAAGLTYEGAASGYVTSITRSGVTLAEFTKGPNSGWLYKVNDTMPNIALTQCVLTDGDDIVWYYTEDWKLDSDAGMLADTPALNTSAKEELTDGETPTAGALPFADALGHWGADAIGYVYDRGLMNGVSDTSFAPNGTLNRAMMVTMLYRLEGSPAVTAARPFSDVEDGRWYTDAVTWASANSIVNGVGNGRFDPMASITREQMAVMLYNYAFYKGYDMSERDEMASYTDAPAISEWALAPMEWAKAAGLISGRSATHIVPGGTATRAEAATILMRFMENIVTE